MSGGVPGSAFGLEVGEMRRWDLNWMALQQFQNALWDVLALVWWMLVSGCVAFGGCWYLCQFVYEDWARVHPPPRSRVAEERKLRRELDQGLADLEAYLHDRDPVPRGIKAPQPKQTLTWWHQGWRWPRDRT